MTTPTPEPPTTGHRAIDAALASVRLGDDIHTHLEELSRALEVVSEALRGGPQPPLPEAPKPQTPRPPRS